MRTTRPTSQQLKQLTQQVLNAVLGTALQAAARADDGSPMTVVRAAEASGPARLAQVHPAGMARTEAEALYAGCLRHYREAVRPQDLAGGLDDAAAAVAHFVAANLFALGSARATPALLARLEQQLLPLARLSANWVTSSTAERQAFFEQVALLSVLIDGMAQHASAHGPAAEAKVRHAARLYLRQFLGLDPDELTLDANGLAMRASAPARRAA